VAESAQEAIFFGSLVCENVSEAFANALGVMLLYGLGIGSLNRGHDVVALGITVDNLVKGLTVLAEDRFFGDIKSVVGCFARFLRQSHGNYE
jgi:hypothetical protein